MILTMGSQVNKTKFVDHQDNPHTFYFGSSVFLQPKVQVISTVILGNLIKQV